jgi:hypothetical protein
MTELYAGATQRCLGNVAAATTPNKELSMGREQLDSLGITIDRWPNGYVTVRWGPMSLYMSPRNFETLFQALSRVHSGIQAERDRIPVGEVRH